MTPSSHFATSDTRITIAAAPFDFDATVRSHGWYDLPPFSYDRAAGRLTVRLERAGKSVLVTFESLARGLKASSAGIAANDLRALGRRMFCLDWDLSSFYGDLAGHPKLAWVRRGAGRFLRAPSTWEDATKMLLTTNCSWAATRGMVRRLVDLVGAGSVFPSAASVAAWSEARLRAEIRCGYRSPSLLAFAERVAEGRTDLSEWDDRSRPSDDLRAAILREPGLGPYAAEGLLRLLGRHEFFAFDSWTRGRYAELYRRRPETRFEKSVARRYARFGQFQGLAFWLDLTSRWHDDSEKLWP